MQPIRRWRGQAQGRNRMAAYQDLVWTVATHDDRARRRHGRTQIEDPLRAQNRRTESKPAKLHQSLARFVENDNWRPYQ